MQYWHSLPTSERALFGLLVFAKAAKKSAPSSSAPRTSRSLSGPIAYGFLRAPLFDPLSSVTFVQGLLQARKQIGVKWVADLARHIESKMDDAILQSLEKGMPTMSS